jgi:hypothetical protein
VEETTSEELNDRYLSLNIFRFIENKIIWLCRIANIGKRKLMYSVVIGKPKLNTQLGKQELDVSLVLKS